MAFLPDSESAENSASNCVFKILKNKNFITHAGDVEISFKKFLVLRTFHILKFY